MSDPVSIFILKSQPGSMMQAETFLRNRQWIVASSTNLRDALAYIIQRQPQYVMLSSDHPNQKVRILPKLLLQAFQIHIIGFAEKGSGLSTKNLQDMKFEYNLFPPVSGPAIERMILKIRRDMETRSLDAGRELRNETIESRIHMSRSPAFSFNGDSSSAKEMQSSFEQARAALSDMLSDENQSEEEGSQSNNSGQEGLSRNRQKPAFFKGEGPRAPGSTPRAPASGETFQDGKSDWTGNASTENGGNSPAAPASAESADPASSPPPAENRPPRTLGTPLPKKPDALIVRGTETALLDSVNLKGADKFQKISQSKNIACITIQSPKFSGYLVCAMGKNRPVDKSFLEVCRSRLFGFLRANGESIRDQDSMELELQEIDFTSWALEQAEFLRRSIHDGNEVAMAFFQNPEGEVELGASASEKMVKMSLDDLKEDVALEFDLYIFMPENNKYLLYTPKGQTFYSNQKGRLSGRGITHMHLRRDSVHEVKKYKAQNFLNDRIANYKAAKGIS